MKLQKLKKALVIGSILMATLTVNPVNVVPFTEVTTTVCAATKPTVETKADVVYWVYRVKGDWIQRRRWNETRGYWVDPFWINVEKVK